MREAGFYQRLFIKLPCIRSSKYLYQLQLTTTCDARMIIHIYFSRSNIITSAIFIQKIICYSLKLLLSIVHIFTPLKLESPLIMSLILHIPCYFLNTDQFYIINLFLVLYYKHLLNSLPSYNQG